MNSQTYFHLLILNRCLDMLANSFILALKALYLCLNMHLIFFARFPWLSENDHISSIYPYVLGYFFI